MTVPMSVQERIRKLDHDGISGRQIATQLGISRSTVAKYLAVADYSPQPPTPRSRPAGSVIAGHEDTIKEWLDEDKKFPRKQRHTAQRVFDRLRDEEGYTGTYSPVQRFIKRHRQAEQTADDGFLELDWDPGTVQVDFGEAEAFINQEQRTVHVLVVTYPFSNMRFAQAYRGETAECVCHGLRTIFEHVGSVPRQMIFDNATGIGRRQKTKILESKLFAAFKAHYCSEAKYCNPDSGNEKGNVENAVGFLRRNFMVPVPRVGSYEALNQFLLEAGDRLGAKEHWRHRTPIGELFTRDQAAGLPLPGVEFDPVRYESRKADKYGNLLVEKNHYAAGPVFAGRAMTVGIRHDAIEILDEHARPIRSFERVYGQQSATASEPSSVLGLLAHRPGAWANSPIRAQVGQPVRDWLDTADAQDRRRLLGALDTASAATSFASAVQAATQLISQGDDPGQDMLGMLARRVEEGTDPQTGQVDLSVYDQLFAPAPAGMAATAEAGSAQAPRAGQLEVLV